MHSLSYNHPSADALAASAGGADTATANHARDHAQDCPVCRAELLDYQRIIDVLRGHNVAHSADNGEHLSVEELQSYIELDAKDPVRIGFHRHIQACGQCMKVALTLCARGVTSQAMLTRNDRTASNLNKMQSTWFSPSAILKGNSIVLMAGAAFLMATSSLGTWMATRGAMPELLGTSIATYQDDEMMYFTSTSGAELGGFSTSARRATPFSGIQVHETADHRYQARWDSVPGAVEYELRIFSFAGGEPRVEFSQVVLVPRAMIPGRQLRAGGRFEWELRGKTFDDLAFTARGGFVIQSLLNRS